MMKKTILTLAALGAALTLSAQEIRTNFRSEGMTHISTDFEPCQDFTARVERVGFPDGSSLWQLFIDLRQKTAFTAPKGVKMTATLPGGSIVRAAASTVIPGSGGLKASFIILPSLRRFRKYFQVNFQFANHYRDRY